MRLAFQRTAGAWLEEAMFNFLGVFADHRELIQSLKGRWPTADVRTIRDPFDGAAVRIPENGYDPAEEELPDAFLADVVDFSCTWTETRFLALRTWCWGGQCSDDGRIVEAGMITHSATDDPLAGSSDALIHLVTKMGGTIGPSGLFDPLSRYFDWSGNA